MFLSIGGYAQIEARVAELAERIYCMYLHALEGGDADEYVSKEVRKATAVEALKAAFTFFEMHKNWVDEAAVERYERERK